ncbi:MAG: hypothetical protein FJ044_03855 [Candidatus Cloacimonetes bacterium]|nr:hypothetical protein [Candidatus Cloacimonadota bacterium]
MSNGLLTYAEYEKILKARRALVDAEAVLKKVTKKSCKTKKRTCLKPGEIDPEYGVPYGSEEWWEMTHKEALADIKAGRVKSFDSVEDLIADLHKHS